MNSKKLSFQKIGQQYKDFIVTKILDLPELHCKLIELVHKSTGAQVLHIANDDPENLFCLSFKTIPTTSNGIAHILEHTVLCGSKKFPVKDPFFAMQRRSLNTFMNALTGSDFTCYPAATQVPNDFYNLLEVYLDAVFCPHLNELSFLQEGHRLELTDPSDPQSPLEFKGIVYNEMKGSLASPATRLHEAMNAALFPNLTYGVNAGGDPKDIPDLTYHELLDFHRTFYHPSRCLFFFYGNMPLKKHLDFIAKQALNDVKPAFPLPRLPLQPRFTEPKRIVASYPIPLEEDTRDKALIAFGWLTCHILDQMELLALSILEIILMDTDASPLKMAFLKSGLCKQALCFMDAEITEIPVVIELKGCNPNNCEALQGLMQSTLKDVVRKGIPLEQVENAIHQLEFYRSEITGNHAPFGLSLFMRSALLKQHGGESESGLQIHMLFDEVRKRNLEDPRYLTSLMEKYFLNNPHHVQMVMIPDKELAAKELAEEQVKLAKIQKGLSEAEKLALIKKTAELNDFQQKQDSGNLNILPKVTLADVPKSSRYYPLTEEDSGNLKVYHHSCFTNEIVYADLVFDLPYVTEEDLPYVRLLTSLLPQMGCNGRGYAENLEYIQANTGGIGSSLILNLQAENHHQSVPSLFIRGKALHRKVDKLFPLLHDLAASVDFTDAARLKEAILKQHAALESSLNRNALKYAINLSSSGLNIPSKIAYIWYGLKYFWMIRTLALGFEKQEKWLIEKLNELKSKLLCNPNPHLVISSDAQIYDLIKRCDFYGLNEISTIPQEKWKNNYPLDECLSQGRIIATPIAFIGKALQTVSYMHPDAPALHIASFLFDNLTLHKKLREQGGAYGGGAACNSMSGIFYFYSYRDPNILSSLKAFDAAIQRLEKGNFKSSDLEEAKMEMMQALDAPVAPGSRGDIAYGWLREGKTLDMRQTFRERILSLNRQDIIRAVKNQLIPNMPSARTIVFANRDLLEKENLKFIEEGLAPLPIERV